jgi:hypothetical protein
VQCKALSEKLLVGQQYENLETKSNISQGQTFSADLQHHPSEKFATGKFGQLDNTKNHQTSSQGDEEYTPSSSSDVQVEGLCGHLNGSRTFDSNGRITEGNSLVARVTSNGVIEQIERGVYVTFAVSPCGKKDIKRVRFRWGPRMTYWCFILPFTFAVT